MAASQSRRLNMIADLDNNKETWRLRVRVTRLYAVPSWNNPNETSRIEMILLDEKNGKIQATVKDKLIRVYRPLIHEGELYTISNFVVLENNDNLKSCKCLRDIFRTDKSFGGKVVVFGGDFRQILPVIPKGSRQDIVHSTINASYLWRFRKVLKLTKNMRLLSTEKEVNLVEVAKFSDWILNIGDGTLGEPNDGEATIEIPPEMLIQEGENPIAAIVENTYPSYLENLMNASYFQERAILAPTHETVEMVNDYLLEKVSGEEKIYLSSDSICKSQILDAFDESAYSTELLNSIRCSGLPNHELRLKIGVPVMLLRNLDQAAGLCNGTRLVITRLGERVIEAKIISGRNIGHKVAIARMTLSPSDT